MKKPEHREDMSFAKSYTAENAELTFKPSLSDSRTHTPSSAIKPSTTRDISLTSF